MFNNLRLFTFLCHFLSHSLLHSERFSVSFTSMYPAHKAFSIISEYIPIFRLILAFALHSLHHIVPMLKMKPAAFDYALQLTSDLKEKKQFSFCSSDVLRCECERACVNLN